MNESVFSFIAIREFPEKKMNLGRSHENAGGNVFPGGERADLLDSRFPFSSRQSGHSAFSRSPSDNKERTNREPATLLITYSTCPVHVSGYPAIVQY